MTDQVRGIISVLNIPFTEDNSIDVPGLQRNVANAIQAGVAGFLVPAMASEVSCLTAAERRDIVELVVSESDSRAVVIGGASAESQEQRLQLSRDFIDSGCDGILVQMSAQTAVDVLESDLSELAALEPEILMVQDWDSTGTGLPLATILQLLDRIERFNWLKVEVNGAGPKYSEVLQATDGRLNVAGGWAVTQMIDGLDRGVHAFMPTAMHSIYVEIYKRYVNGNRAGAAELFQRIQPVLAFSNQSLEVSIRFFKRMLHAQGFYATPNVRTGGPQFSTEQAEQADRLIQTVIQIEEELSANR